MQEKILILDFGSQYTQLIARRVRELNVYCEIHPFNRIPALDASVRGVILSGSPYSVRDKEAPRVDLSAIKGKLPLLGVCYGAQYLSHCYGGEVAPSATREYGRAMLSKTEGDNPLIRDLSERTQVWMSHGDTIVRIPESYRIIASTEDVPVAAFQIDGEQTWGIQFHPEVYHSTEGKQLLKHFVVDICGCRQDWTPASFVESTVAELREKIGPRQSAARVVRGSRLVGSGHAAASGRRPATDLHFRRYGTAPQGRVRERTQIVRVDGAERDRRPRRRKVPLRPERSDRSRAQTQDHRAGLHRGIRRRGAEADRRALARSGDDLSRRDRVDVRQRSVGHDQVAP